MRQRLIYILKHNSFIQTVYRIVLSSLFRLWGAMIRTEQDTVLFVSFMGMAFNDSPQKIYEYIKSHQEYNKYRCVWAFEHPEDYPDLETVKIDSFLYFRTAIHAKYWITNTNIERGLHFKRKDQVYLNTWHGVTIKYIGNDVTGRHDFNFNNVDHLCVCGDYDEQIFRSAFQAKEESFLRCGLPRNEALWNVSEGDQIQIRQKLNIPFDKRIILYAPTWRESSNKGKSYDLKLPVHIATWKKELGDNYVVLFRAHHQTTKVFGIQFDDFIRDVSSYPDVNELLIASDILITDYSAIAFDYSILCKPILCYAYDYDDYVCERGVYFRIDEKYPNKSCRTEAELLKRLKSLNYNEECKATKRFRDEFMQYGMNATEICVKAEFGK